MADMACQSSPTVLNRFLMFLISLKEIRDDKTRRWTVIVESCVFLKLQICPVDQQVWVRASLLNEGCCSYCAAAAVVTATVEVFILPSTAVVYCL